MAVEERSLGEWSLILKLAGQARELGGLALQGAGSRCSFWSRCDKVFESFRKLSQMVRGPDDTEEVEPKEGHQTVPRRQAAPGSSVFEGVVEAWTRSLGD